VYRLRKSSSFLATSAAAGWALGARARRLHTRDRSLRTRGPLQLLGNLPALGGVDGVEALAEVAVNHVLRPSA